MGKKLLLGLGIVLMLAAAPAYADSVQSCGTDVGGSTCLTTAGPFDYLFKADLSTSGTTFDLTFTAQNNTATAAYLNVFSLQLFTDTTTVTSDNLASYPGWTASNSKAPNSGGAGCKGSHPGWLCVSSSPYNTSEAAAIAAGGTDTFTFAGTFSGSVEPTFDLMTNGGPTGGSNKDFAISDSTVTPAPVAPVDEPASFLLLGSGLLAAAGWRHRWS